MKKIVNALLAPVWVLFGAAILAALAGFGIADYLFGDKS